MRKQTIAVDFDGVIHSYTSGWKGMSVIPDEPVEGALDWLVRASERYDIAISSARSRSWRGRRAMRRWLREKLRWHFYSEPTESMWGRFMTDVDLFELAGMEARKVVRRIRFPRHKPVASVYIDDRAVRFEGDWSAIDPEAILALKPWNQT